MERSSWIALLTAVFVLDVSALSKRQAENQGDCNEANHVRLTSEEHGDEAL